MKNFGLRVSSFESLPHEVRVSKKKLLPNLNIAESISQRSFPLLATIEGAGLVNRGVKSGLVSEG